MSIYNMHLMSQLDYKNNIEEILNKNSVLYADIAGKKCVSNAIKMN